MSVNKSDTPKIDPQAEHIDPPQPLITHLAELRTRLLRSFLAVFVIFLGLIYFANDIYFYVATPLREQLQGNATMIATEVASPLLAPFKLTLFLSFFLAMPYVLHQIWSFIAPGLYQHEKKIAVPLLLSSILLFYLGIGFAQYVVNPLLFGFFTSVAPADVTIMTDINKYLEFILKMYFSFGAAFEIPIATMLLIWSGITTVESLAAKRPYVIVGCFVVGMLLTPPDVISQLLLAFPMWILFETGLLFGRLIRTREAAPGQ